MAIELFGEVLIENGSTINYSLLEKIIKRPFIKPRYRISVLNPDESVNYVIPDEDIPEDGISYTENYQNGQRRNITLKLINTDKNYTPSIYGVWINTRFKLDIGIQTTANNIIWFPRGVYIMGGVDLTSNDSDKTVSIQLQDKYAIFEGKTGTLDVAYEVELGSDIEDAIHGILNFSMGNGYILDYKDIIIDPSFVGMKTQTTIRAEEGDTLNTIIDGLATQLSAEYYYNNVGNLCFYPINETVNDDAKPIIWTFANLGRDLHNLNLAYQMENVVNCVKVVGNNIDKGIYSAIVTNENPASPICIQQIGKRIAPTYNSENVWNDELANDLAKYYLRKASFVAVDFNCNVSFNPVLSVNNVCEVEHDFLNLKRDKLLITSISFTSDTGLMSIKFCNTQDLPFMTRYTKQ